MRENFHGDQKHLNHFLLNYERKILFSCLPYVPQWMTTAHLTLMTLLWSVLVAFFGYLAATQNINWLWGSTVCIFLQHVTDMLDGEIGRQRNTGLITWGFYMDHFLDYTFLCGIIIGYSFLLPVSYSLLVLLCLVICAGFMIHTFLDFGITNDLKISFNRFGVSESRYVIMALNTIIIFAGTGILVKGFPYFVGTFFVALCIVVYQSQKGFWKTDMIKHDEQIEAEKKQGRKRTSFAGQVI